MEVPVVTEKLESRMGEEWAFEKWGLSVRKVSRTYARENQLDDDTGVIVIGVQPGFPAAVAGLAAGDIITRIDQQPLTTLDDLKRIYQSFEAKPVLAVAFDHARPARVPLRLETMSRALLNVRRKLVWPQVAWANPPIVWDLADSWHGHLAHVWDPANLRHRRPASRSLRRKLGLVRGGRSGTNSRARPGEGN